MITLSQYDAELNIIELGEFQLSQLDKLFQEKSANAKLVTETAEESITKTCFMLSRSDLDFIQLDFLFNGKVKFESDRLIYPTDFLGKLRNILRNKDYLSCELNLNDAKQLCQDYISLDRQAFEQKFQHFYTY